ncbi:MAG: hypothetical protein D3922_11050 [Candidatus Electrothrix sp. AR1]|nr:hypothetical protein [Candidatus Electrothrix sp. AR1]
MANILFSILLTIFIYSVCYAQPGSKIFYEDFSSYADGELPVGWIGGDNLGVSQINKKKVLKDLVNNPYDVTTKKIDFSRDFKATILIKHFCHNKYAKYRDRTSSHPRQTHDFRYKFSRILLPRYRAGVRWPICVMNNIKSVEKVT